MMTLHVLRDIKLQRSFSAPSKNCTLTIIDLRCQKNRTGWNGEVGTWGSKFGISHWNGWSHLPPSLW